MKLKNLMLGFMSVLCVLCFVTGCYKEKLNEKREIQ